MAVARIELPRVFAVESNDRQVVLVALLLADALEAPNQVARAVDRRHALIVEADRVRYRRVAKDHRERFAFALHIERAVKLVGCIYATLVVAIKVRVQGARQHLLVADHPVEAPGGPPPRPRP